MAKPLTPEQREKRKTYYANYYSDPLRREKRRLYMREAHAKNRTEHNKSRTGLYRSIRGRARHLARMAEKRRPEGFGLTPEWVQEKLERGVCEITGIPLLLAGPPKGAWSPSLDRTNNALGYTKENTKLVCYMYNTAKMVSTHAAVVRFAEAVCIAEKS